MIKNEGSSSDKRNHTYSSVQDTEAIGGTFRRSSRMVEDEFTMPQKGSELKRPKGVGQKKMNDTQSIRKNIIQRIKGHPLKEDSVSGIEVGKNWNWLQE